MDNVELHISWSRYEAKDDTLQQLITWLLDNRCNDKTSPHYEKKVVVEALVRGCDPRYMAIILEPIGKTFTWHTV